MRFLLSWYAPGMFIVVGLVAAHIVSDYVLYVPPKWRQPWLFRNWASVLGVLVALDAYGWFRNGQFPGLGLEFLRYVAVWCTLPIPISAVALWNRLMHHLAERDRR